MSNSIIKLEASDFGEAIAHLNVVFNDPDFASLVPALYQPTDAHMGCNFAVRRNGKIAAMVGLFPIDWIIGREQLSLAGIGGVSVHPDFRGQGLMRLLMDEIMAEVARGGFHAACLGGNRRRYGYWGFEKAGVESSFLVTANSLEHSLHNRGSEIRGAFQVRKATDADSPEMHALYRQLTVRCSRSKDSFPRHLRNWRKEPVVVCEESGRIAGYGCLDPNDRSCVELCCESADALEGFLIRHVATTGRAMRISMPMIQNRQFNRIEELSDDVSVIEASNWRIYDWPAVLGALLKAKHSVSPLPAGNCVVKLRTESGFRSEVKAKSTIFRLFVAGDASCEHSDDHPDFEVDESGLLRTLASPLSYPLPPRATSLALWRPLPLMIPMQDRI